MDETKNTELIYFHQLKKTVRTTVETKLEIRKDFKDWSGSDIQTFQVDLEETCKSTVSEKWVYTHFKNESEKLPRVDVLNLLASYCGFKNWDDFKFKNAQKTAPKPKAALAEKRKIHVLFWVALPLILGGLFWWFSGVQKTVLIFKDAYTQKTIATQNLKVSFGKNKMQTAASFIALKNFAADTLLADGVYYKPQKIWLNPEESTDTVRIEMYPDDYALMLNYFSRSQHNDWEKRQKQLDAAIHDDAQIFQIHEKYNGIEMLNKTEFIDRLILPVNSLKNLEIKNIIYENGQIIRLRFVQNLDENETK